MFRSALRTALSAIAIAGLVAVSPVLAASFSPGGSNAPAVTGGACGSGQYANSISTAGVPTCSTPPAGGSSTVGLLSGNWYTLQGITPAGAITVASNSARCAPGVARASYTIQALGTKISTAGAAGTNINMGIFANGANNKPTGPAIAAANISAAAAAAVSATITGSPALTAGSIYWFCIVADNSTAVVPANGPIGFNSLIGATSLADVAASSSGLSGMSASMTYSATWPADVSTLTWAELPANTPSFYLQQQ